MSSLKTGMLLSSLFSSCFSFAATMPQEQIDTTVIPKAQLLSAIVPAKPIDRKEPKYPYNALQKGAEGWVEISYVIDEQGNVVDPIVINSAGGHQFERSALNAIKGWKYSPAKENGTPILQCNHKVRLDYNLQNNGVSAKFKRFFDSANEKLEKSELAELYIDLTESNWNESSNLIELSLYHYLLAEYYGAMGNSKQQIAHILKSTGRKAEHRKEIHENIIIRNLQNLFVAEIQTNDLANAQKTYQEITKIDSDIAKQLVNSFAPYAERIKALAENDTLVSQQIVINNSGSHFHNLLKSGFYVNNIKGSLTSLEVRCPNKRNKYTVMENNHWKIPKAWGDCSVLFEGKPGSSLIIIEANKPAENSQATAQTD